MVRSKKPYLTVICTSFLSICVRVLRDVKNRAITTYIELVSRTRIERRSYSNSARRVKLPTEKISNRSKFHF